MAKEDAKTIQLVDRILERAITDGSSDVHIEPRKDQIRVRFRVDGVLVGRPPIPTDLTNSVISRIKVMAQIDIAERRMPQGTGLLAARSGRRPEDTRLWAVCSGRRP